MKKWRKTSLTEKYLLRQAPQQLSSPTIFNKVINSIDLKTWETWETVPIRENLPCFLSTKVPALQQQFSTKLPATNTITLACNFSLLIRNPQFPLLLPLRKIQRKVKKKKTSGRVLLLWLRCTTAGSCKYARYIYKKSGNVTFKAATVVRLTWIIILCDVGFCMLLKNKTEIHLGWKTDQRSPLRFRTELKLTSLAQQLSI